MKKGLVIAAIALSSLTTLSACANNNGTANSNTHPAMQQHHAQYANNGQGRHMHSGYMNRGHMNRSHMNEGMGYMMSELNLTAEQKSQLQAMRQNNRSNRLQNHQAMLEILTPEQRQKLAQMQSQHMNNGGHMNNGHMMNRGHMNNNHMNNSHMNNNSHMMNQGQHSN